MPPALAVLQGCGVVEQVSSSNDSRPKVRQQTSTQLSIPACWHRELQAVAFLAQPAAQAHPGAGHERAPPRSQSCNHCLRHR